MRERGPQDTEVWDEEKLEAIEPTSTKAVDEAEVSNIVKTPCAKQPHL